MGTHDAAHRSVKVIISSSQWRSDAPVRIVASQAPLLWEIISPIQACSLILSALASNSHHSGLSLRHLVCQELKRGTRTCRSRPQCAGTQQAQKRKIRGQPTGASQTKALASSALMNLKCRRLILASLSIFSSSSQLTRMALMMKIYKKVQMTLKMYSVCTFLRCQSRHRNTTRLATR